MIVESYNNAEADMRERQLREARVEADAILTATTKAISNSAWETLSADEQAEVLTAERALRTAYHANDHHLVTKKIEELNEATNKLAENMMNTAVRGALKGHQKSTEALTRSTRD